MKNISINHLRVFKNFLGKGPLMVKDYERYLLNYVSLPTARKIIKNLIDNKLLKVLTDPKDKRKKMLEVLKIDYDDYI